MHFHRLTILCVAAAVAFSPAVGAVSAEGVRIAGSDLAKTALLPALIESAGAPGRDWTLNLEGTRPGLAALREGRADAVVALLDVLPSNPEPGVQFAPIAYRAPVIVVSIRNPIGHLTLPALAAVIGEGEIENFRRWSDLGLPGEWAARSISIHAGTADDPLLFEYLRQRVLKSSRLKSSISTPSSIASLLARLREDESAMGILSAPPADMTGLRVIPVARDTAGIPFGPTPENLHAGDYPMGMVFAVATARGGGANASTVLKVLLSDGVAQALAAHGFVPAPAGARARFAAGLGAN